MDDTIPSEQRACNTKYRSTEEVAEALESLSDEALLRLNRISKIRSYRVPGVEAMELRNTAIERSLSGSRRWPRCMEFVPYLASVIQSLANEHWKKHYREKDIFAQVRSKSGATESPDGLPQNVPSEHPDPESELIVKRDLQEIEALFSDDEDALSIIMARAEGYTRTETIELFDLDEKRHASATKRIQRKLGRYIEGNLTYDTPKN